MGLKKISHICQVLLVVVEIRTTLGEIQNALAIASQAEHAIPPKDLWNISSSRGVCVCVCVCVCVRACVRVCMRACIHAFVCMHVCLCACIHACVHSCLCVYAFWLCFCFLLCNGLCAPVWKQHIKEYIIIIYTTQVQQLSLGDLITMTMSTTRPMD